MKLLLLQGMSQILEIQESTAAGKVVWTTGRLLVLLMQHGEMRVSPLYALNRTINDLNQLLETSAHQGIMTRIRALYMHACAWQMPASESAEAHMQHFTDAHAPAVSRNVARLLFCIGLSCTGTRLFEQKAKHFFLPATICDGESVKAGWWSRASE